MTSALIWETSLSAFLMYCQLPLLTSLLNVAFSTCSGAILMHLGCFILLINSASGMYSDEKFFYLFHSGIFIVSFVIVE